MYIIWLYHFRFEKDDLWEDEFVSERIYQMCCGNWSTFCSNDRSNSYNKFNGNAYSWKQVNCVVRRLYYFVKLLIFYFAAVSELIRIRVVECASIQRHLFYTDNYLYSLLIKRKTFSNMHHLVQCNCTDSRKLYNILTR